MMTENDAYALGVAVGLIVQHYDVEIVVSSDEFEDIYLREEYQSGLESAGVDSTGTWGNIDNPEDEDEAESGSEWSDAGEPQADLFHGGPGHPSNPEEDGVYVIEVSGTPGLFSRYVSTMGWSHPTAIRKDLDRKTLPFIGWPYWNWKEEE